MAKQIKKDEEIKETIVYIGDNLGLDLIKDSVYIGGIPKYIQEKFIKYPELNNLFVPLSKLVDKKKKLKEVGSLEYISNMAIKEVRK